MRRYFIRTPDGEYVETLISEGIETCELIEQALPFRSRKAARKLCTQFSEFSDERGWSVVELVRPYFPSVQFYSPDLADDSGDYAEWEFLEAEDEQTLVMFNRQGAEDAESIAERHGLTYYEITPIVSFLT